MACQANPPNPCDLVPCGCIPGTSILIDPEGQDNGGAGGMGVDNVLDGFVFNITDWAVGTYVSFTWILVDEFGLPLLTNGTLDPFSWGTVSLARTPSNSTRLPKLYQTYRGPNTDPVTVFTPPTGFLTCSAAQSTQSLALTAAFGGPGMDLVAEVGTKFVGEPLDQGSADAVLTQLFGSDQAMKDMVMNTMEQPIYACGDGEQQMAEACDDGNTTPGDGCNEACLIENTICGDGIWGASEECDDGNTQSGDGCDATCALEPVAVCGDGVITPPETCDDSNALDGDGCSATCQSEMPPGGPRAPDTIIGSDTFDGVMHHLIEAELVTAPAGGGVNGGIGATSAAYLGLGSSTAERQMEGAANLGEPECGPVPPAAPNPAHPGCQEIAPMSRQMDSSICDDAESTFAEGMAVCDDGLAVFTDNQSIKGDSASACSNWKASNYAQSNNQAGGDSFVGTVGQLGAAGTLPSGYVIGAGGMEAWKDVLRVIYTGCKNNQGDCVGSVDRLARCGDAIRDELISRWNSIQAGTDCNAGGTCPNGLRRAYRRDDNSGTTGVFLGFLGVSANLSSRQKVVSDGLDCFQDSNRCCDNGQIRIWGIPGDHAFCDGGQNENFLPDCQNGSYIPVGGDPIRRNCVAEDDLCDANGQGGVVQAIVSTPSEADAFASHQCSGTIYRATTYMTSNRPVCPDGRTPVGDLCLFPIFNQGGSGNQANCMAASNSRSPLVGVNVDGRTYNIARRNAGNQVQFVGPNYPRVPNWRMNSWAADNDNLFGRFIPGFPITPSESVCTRASATEQIGCIVSHTTCTIGYAGREAVYSPSSPGDSLLNEPFKVQKGAGANVPPSDTAIGNSTYALARPLYVNALGGFENLSNDCLARGENAAWCADELNIANAFYSIDVGSPAHDACVWAGYIPRTNATRVCVGTAGSTGAPGCGQPVSQPITACQPL